MTRIPSFTFAGGVLSRALWGRYDLNKYQTGLKKANNAFLSVEGGIIKRWGTYFTGARKFQDPSEKAKLIPWRIADDDSYVLEFGDNYIRFIRFGGYVTIPGSHVPHADSDAVNVGGVMEVPSVWTTEQVAKLKFTFANDIMYIAEKDNSPRQLRRLGLYDWDLSTLNFDPHPDWSGTVTATYHDDTTVDDNYDPEPVQTRYKISATLSDGTETKASPVEQVNADLGHRRTRVELNWPNYPDAVQYTIYKGANGIYGFIGYSDVSEYIDRNYAPSYDVVPIGARIPFGSSEDPSVIEFYKQRLAYASTESKTQDIWFSRPLIFGSMTKSIPLQDDDAFQLSLVGRERHTINHMVMLKKFIIFTDSSEWTLNTVENAALTAASADPVIETSYGAHPYLRPLVIGNRILFVQNKTGAVMDMGYEYTADAFKADDLTRLCRDLFQGKEIVAWDYAIHPHNVLFCVLSDGTLGIMTYVREHEIWGWTTASTDGKFIDVACVTESKEEGVYFQVEREIEGEKAYYIERWTVDQTNEMDNMIFMDSAVTYDLHDTYVFDWVNENNLTIYETPDWPIGTLLQIQLPDGTVYYGTTTTEATPMPGPGIDGIEVEPTNSNDTFAETDFTEAVVYVLAKDFDGYDHLEGKTVWAIADGKVYKDIVITDGGFSLPKLVARMHAGLPFTTRIETLDIDAEPARAQFREKTIHEIVLNIKDSRGVYVGIDHPDFDLDNIPPRDSSTNMYLANGMLNGAYELPSHINWGNTCEVVIESRDPLPLHILNIAPDIRYGN